ncbi:MAG: aspartate/glutamate racemase family protein [Planctomycetaceae bacterium]|nr:aspartate/glutamate racemase family protein [Planctomycetaceae bacterium]
MKTIGMLGGMSWESTVTYYQVVNRLVKERLGGLHSAKCALVSVDFHGLEADMAKGDWDAVAATLVAAGQRVEAAGADFLLICTNTMHKVAGQVEAAVEIPLLHIADAAADAMAAQGIHKAALLGTAYTMEQDFYTKRLTARGFEVIIPDADDRARLNRIIFDELCRGIILPESKAFAHELVEKMQAAGAEGAILGCTEIGLIITQDESDCPLFDTALIHAAAAVDMALAE